MYQLNETTEQISGTRMDPDPELTQLATTSVESQTQTSIDGLPHLPYDLHAAILKRVPVNSLVRFRCVSISWRSLIANPIFVKMELDFHFKSRTRIILSRYLRTIVSVGPEEFTPIPNSVDNGDTVNGFEIAQQLDMPLIRGHTYYVKGHCDGLLCVIFNDGTIVIWNPSIREYRTLPTPSDFRNTREVLGLGFDSSANDYKVVRAPSAYCKFKVKDYHPQVEVLSLGSNLWRKLPDEVTPPYFIEHYQQSITVNDGLYWLTLEDFVTVLLRFDFAEEKFKLVPPPPEVMDRNMTWIGVLKGSLCVTHSQRWSYVDIWMTKNDRTWTKLVTIHKCVPDSYHSSTDYSPLCFTKSGAVLMSIRGKGLVTYDPRLHYYKKLKVLEDQRWLQETVYTETLVSPYGNSGATNLSQQSTDLARETNQASLLQCLIGLIHMPCNILRWFS